MEAAARGTSRYIDLVLLLRSKQNGEVLLGAGGRWDQLQHCYSPEQPKSLKAVDLNESQAQFVRWFAEWLAAFRQGRPRDTSLAIAGGDRRGGKTFCLTMCTLAACIDVPRVDGSEIVAWIVSSSYKERDEIDREIQKFLPPTWYSYRQAPEYRYRLANGAQIRNISADDPETLKQGRVDILFYNEAQKMQKAALSNGIMGTADKGGIALLAANPPRSSRGEWVLSLKEAIDEKRVGGALFFEFFSKQNQYIDQSARSRVGGIVRVIDPKAAEADDDGAWLPVGDRAYPKYSRKTMAKPTPSATNGNITRDITRDFTKNRIGRAYDYVGGVDFQATPWHAGAVFKIFGSFEKPIYWIVDEIICEQSTEDDFIDEVEERGYAPETLLWIGDASGCWQDSKHRTPIHGRTSFDFFQARRWHILPPRLKKTEQSEHAKNPHVADRLSLVMRLMEQDRFRLDPDRCSHADEAFKECPLKSVGGGRKLPSGRFAHIGDAAGYALFWLEPRPTPPRAPLKESILIGGTQSRGPRIL